MHFAGLNLFAVVLAAVVSFMFGWLWYGILFSKQWMGACGKTEADMKAQGAPSPTPFVISFVALLVMAWVLATWPDALTRDGNKAVAAAERANTLTNGKSPIVSATLAAAYAEAGRFADAITNAQRALKLAAEEGNTARADSIGAQLAVYRSGAAFRDRRNSP